MHNAPTSHHITLQPEGLEACSMHYLTHGTPDKPVVFCVHALTSVAHDFDHLAKRLQDDFYIIAPDMPGRGLSGHLSDKTLYSNEHYLSYCVALLEHLGIEHMHWVGASMGGILGMMACMALPERIRSLMLNDVGKVLSKQGLIDIFDYLDRPVPKRDNAALEAHMHSAYWDAFGFTDETQWRAFYQHRITQDEDGYDVLRSDPAIVQGFKNALMDISRKTGITDVDLGMIWQQVQCPVLLHRGEHSTLLSEATAQAMRDEDGKDVTYHNWPNCGHMPNMIDDDQLSVIHQWLLRHAL